MEVITIDSIAFKQLISRIEELDNKIEDVVFKAARPLGEKWMDVQDVCQELNISKRTLQYYREDGLLPYSNIKHKVYFRSSDIQKFLLKNYHKVRGY